MADCRDDDERTLDLAAEEVAERLRAYERSRDPASLWPGLSEPTRVRAAREIERVTRRVLAGERGVPLDPSGSHEEYAVTIAAYTTGMGPLLGRWAEDGLITARAAIAEHLQRHLAQGRARAARIEREVMPALDALCRRGITPVVLKGFHTAHVYFEEPGVRRMADVDLLVPQDRAEEAENVLRSIGYTAASEPRFQKRDWIGASVDPRVFSLELSSVHSRWVIEVHGSLDRVFEPGSVARLDRARTCLRTFEIAGRSLLVPSQPLLLLLLACHTSLELHSSRLLRILEIVRVVRADSVDWDDVLAMARATGAAPFAYPALALANALAPGTIDARLLAEGKRESTWAARHTVSRLTPAGGSQDDRGILRQLMWTRGAAAVAYRFLQTVWPAELRHPRHVIGAWRARLRRLRRGRLLLSAPDERAAEGEP